jgi:hypothetical protein
MNVADRYLLLFGPYRTPALQRGDRSICHYRDSDVVVTGWTEARLPWPRCQALGSKGGSGLLVDDELARAIRHESAVAIQHWWGVNGVTVARWRKSLGVRRADPEGSRRLIQSASDAGAAAVRCKRLTPQESERRRQTAIVLNLKQYLRPGYHGPWWTTQQLQLLGIAPDEAVAAQIGRTPNAIRIMRAQLSIPRFALGSSNAKSQREVEEGSAG